MPALSVSRRTFLQASAAAVGFTRLSQAAAAASGFTRLPYLQRLLADSVSILWTTPQPVAGSVVVSAPDGTQSVFPATMSVFQPSTTQLSSAYYQYQADVTGLQAATGYQYQVMLDGQVAANDPVLNGFSTPTPGDMSFLVFGDSGADSPEQLSLITRMAAETGIAKVMHVGDLAYEYGTFAQLEANYFALYAPLMSRLSFFATPGNHDYITANAAAFLAGHAAPAGNVPAADLGRYYSYDWGDVHFASIDSNLLPTDAASRMLNWLDADLAATGKYWKIVFLHHPPYPTGTHLGDPICVSVQQNVNPIVERHGVQLVLSGHEHGYERSFPLVANQAVDAGIASTMYVITAGGGQTLETVGSLPQCALSVQAFNYLRVDLRGHGLIFTSIGLDGNALDAVTLNPPPVIAPDGVVNAADFTTHIVADSVVTVFGWNFAVRPEVPPASAPSGSIQLGDITVYAEGKLARLLYVSPTQLNLMLPSGIAGRVRLQVVTPNGSATAVITVTAATIRRALPTSK